MLQNFENVFNNAAFEKQKELLHALIKEIKIRKSNNINERLAEEIILHFSELDLMQFDQDKNNSNETFEVNGDTVQRILPNT